jgi:predicted AlkP superfamily pyrophosphatase or phosphodiesterase
VTDLMNYGRILTIFLSLSVTLQALQTAEADDNDRQVRLVLQITVDGLRADLISRGSRQFGEGGFRYLLENGAVFANAHYRHANTETIVGHATLATGAHPSIHGMTGNVWYDAEAG